MDKVKVRFAPSPTGYLHIGSARTALFNWIFSRSCDGEFILRIEDTDQSRSREEFLEEILDSLAWLGITSEEIVYQSKRLDIYRQYARKLIEKGKAFEEEGAVIFKYVFEKVSFDDLIRGHIEFTELPKDREVLIKSDGTPTYNFACVVDDALLGITHVIRGEDHIPNTPKQILLYEALEFDLPQFAHLPMILSPEGGKMSKRFGATSIREYRDQGYLPEALVNYLLLLGWSPGNNREVVSFQEAARVFSLKDINKTAASFSPEKLDWINAEYIKNTDTARLTDIVERYLKEKKFLPEDVDKSYLHKVVDLFKGRISKLGDLLDWAYFCFYDDYSYAEDTKSILERDLSGAVSVLRDRMAALNSFDTSTIEQEFRAVASEEGLKARDLVHPVRVALTGRRIGPGLFETMAVLGKRRVLARLDRLINYWRGK